MNRLNRMDDCRIPEQLYVIGHVGRSEFVIRIGTGFRVHTVYITERISLVFPTV